MSDLIDERTRRLKVSGYNCLGTLLVGGLLVFFAFQNTGYGQMSDFVGLLFGALFALFFGGISTLYFLIGGLRAPKTRERLIRPTPPPLNLDIKSPEKFGE